MHVVMFSTGLSSAVLLDVVYGEHKNTIALLTDTGWEDEDNYRFSDEVIKYVGAKLVKYSHGMTPPEIWFKARYLVGPTGSPCTRILKIEQTIKFIKEHGKDLTLYFGIGADEEHRAENLIRRYEPLGVKVRFPLIDRPMHHYQMKDIVENEWGIKIPRMYSLGFSHANCGGRCVKAGQQHFLKLLNVWPDRFDEIAEIEQQFRELTDSDTTILREVQGGEKVKITLHELKDRQKTGQLSLCWETETPCECVI